MPPIFASARRPLTALIILAIVTGIPGLDFYRAFAEKGKQNRAVSSTPGERGLKLPVEGPLREAVQDEGRVVGDAELADQATELETPDARKAELRSEPPQTHAVTPAHRTHPEPPAPLPGTRNGAIKDALAGSPVSDHASRDRANGGNGDAYDYFFPEVLGERRKTAGAEDVAIVSAPTAVAPTVPGPSGLLSVSKRIPYVEEDVHSGAFQRAERADNAKYAGVAVLDVHYTIENQGRLLPGIEQYVARLRDANIKVVLWTGADRASLDAIFARYPGLAAHFDRILTIENYCPGCASHDPRLALKDLSMLGYDWIIDDHPRLAALAEAKGFAHFQVAPFHFDDPKPAGFDRAIGDILELSMIRTLERSGRAEFRDVTRERDAIRAQLGAKPVFVINRAPIKLDASDKSKPAAQIVRSDGGAAPAIKGTLDAAGGGLVLAAANTRAEQALARQKKIMKVGDIWVLYLDIPKDVMDRYYNGFANRWLWPILHGESVSAEFFKDRGGVIEAMRDDFEQGYRKANEQFADAILYLLGPNYGGSLSLEDYHLYLLAVKLRARGFTGLLEHFTHIPWPSPEFVKTLSPENRALLTHIVEGLLANDIVGFHTEEYVENFLLTARTLFGTDFEVEGGGVRITHRGHSTRVRAFPISIDVDAMIREMETPEARAHYERLRRLSKNRTLIVDVARMDPTKGLPQTLQAYEALLESGARRSWIESLTHPIASLRGFVAGKPRPLLYGLFMPSREGIGEYQELQREILEAAERINGRFSPGKWHGIIRHQGDYEEFLSLSPDQVPAVVVQMIITPHPKVLATLAAADVGYTVPLADGMNLVVKEFIVAAANAWRLASTELERHGAKLKQRAARWLLGAGAVLVISRTIGAYAEMGPYVLGIQDPTSISKRAPGERAFDERVTVLRQAIAAAHGQARAPKAEDAMGQILENDLVRWADARRAAIRERSPPDAKAAAAPVAGRDRRSIGARLQWSLLGLGALAASVATPSLWSHFEGFAAVMGVLGSIAFIAMPAVLFARTIANLIRVHGGSVHVERTDAGQELAGLGKRWLPLLSTIGGNVLNFPAFLAIALGGTGFASLLPVTNAIFGAVIPLGILAALSFFGYFSPLKMASIGVGIGAAAAGLPFITPYPWLLDALALLSIPVGFAFPFLQIVYNERSLSSMRRAGASEDEKSRLKAEMGAITPWYLLIGLVGNLIFLPVLMVTGRWYMLLGSSVGMIGTLVILYQLYRAGLFQPGDLLRLSAGSAAWAGLILALSRSIPTDFWK